MSGLPTTPAALSDVSTDDLIDQYGGKVDSQFAAESIMRQYADISPVKGTDTLVDNRVGKTQLQKLVPGVRPDAIPTAFGRFSLVVDTVVLARDNRSMLNEFQTHFNARMKLAEDHGKEIGKFFDQAFLIQTIKGSGQSAPIPGAGQTYNGAFGAGQLVRLSTALDEKDPDKLYAAIALIITTMEEAEIPTKELVIFVRPTQYDVLFNNNKLISADYSRTASGGPSNGNFAAGVIYQLKGVRIEKTARIPITPIVGHFLSNPNNGNAYDVTADEAKTVAIIMHPASLLAGETIPLSSNIFFSDTEKQWFIDSWLSFGVTVRRPDVCGTVRKA